MDEHRVPMMGDSTWGLVGLECERGWGRVCWRVRVRKGVGLAGSSTWVRGRRAGGLECFGWLGEGLRVEGQPLVCEQGVQRMMSTETRGRLEDGIPMEHLGWAKNGVHALCHM